MQTVLMVILLIVALAMIGVILLQRSEGGGLGMGSGGGAGGLMTARGTANFLSRTTAILAALFMFLCLLLGVISSHSKRPASLLDQIEAAPATQSAPAEAAPPAVEVAPTDAPAEAPSVPVGN